MHAEWIRYRHHPAPKCHHLSRKFDVSLTFWCVCAQNVGHCHPCHSKHRYRYAFLSFFLPITSSQAFYLHTWMPPHSTSGWNDPNLAVTNISLSWLLCILGFLANCYIHFKWNKVSYIISFCFFRRRKTLNIFHCLCYCWFCFRFDGAALCVYKLSNFRFDIQMIFNCLFDKIDCYTLGYINLLRA